MSRRFLPLLLAPLALAPVACGSGHTGPLGVEAVAAEATRTNAPAEQPPLKAAPAKRELPPVTLAFGGDVHFEGVDAQRLASDPQTALAAVAPVLSAADLAMVNLETAVTNRGTPAPKQYVFRAPPTAFVALRAAGIDVATMANNHGMDFGVVGLRDSLAAAKTASLPVVGIGVDEAHAYTPYTATIRGVRVAVIGATQVLDDNLIEAWTARPGKPGLASAKRVDRIVAAVRGARASADIVAVFLHYGTERASCPTSAQRSIASALAEAGADVVVGSHAHVLLGAGWLGNTYVDYGLGNFVFYASGYGANTRSGVLSLTMTGRQVTKAAWTPAHIEGGVARPLSGAAASSALAQWKDLRGCTGLSAAPPR